MGVVKQLYQLQDIDLEIESDERQVSQKVGQLGESETIINLQSKLTSEQKRLDDLTHQQHSAEWEIDDLSGKFSKEEEELYSGRIKNPKDLASLQHEVETMKAKRAQLEDNALVIMDKVEQVEANAATISQELKAVEAEWQSQQQKLSAEKEQLETKLSDLKNRRESLLAEIDPQVAELYHKLSQQKKPAVAKVEQGICGSCRISLPITDLQQVRSGNLVQCSSCGRILFQA